MHSLQTKYVHESYKLRQSGYFYRDDDLSLRKTEGCYSLITGNIISWPNRFAYKIT